MWKYLVVYTYLSLSGNAPMEWKTSTSWLEIPFPSYDMCYDVGMTETYKKVERDHKNDAVTFNYVGCVYFPHLRGNM